MYKYKVSIRGLNLWNGHWYHLCIVFGLELPKLIMRLEKNKDTYMVIAEEYIDESQVLKSKT